MATMTPNTLTGVADAARRRINGVLGDTRAQLGQFMTPGGVADFMAGLLEVRRSKIRILDAGAGVGTLTAAVVERLLSKSSPPKAIFAVCYEVDRRLFAQLEATLASCAERCRASGISFDFEIRTQDYIAARANACRTLFAGVDQRFDCVIMNPPYRKIHSASEERLNLRSMGIETTNLYSAFMLLGARQLDVNGEFISISPRSFCNGPYFRPFRREFLKLLSIRRIHLFDSRRDAFKDDDVLQENVIVYGVHDPSPATSVILSASAPDGTVASRTVSADRIVDPHDEDAVVHIALDAQMDDLLERMSRLPCDLHALDLSVSTGRVVDFRARQHLRQRPTADAAPLIYPRHLKGGAVQWPDGNARKPNAIAINDATAGLLVPSGHYVVTRRLSTKEERRRIVAALFDPQVIEGNDIGFDNKTNYYHRGGQGIDARVARGLTVYLNSDIVDRYFRVFSGHTQVNAADLRRMPYPSAAHLRELSDAVDDLGDHRACDLAVLTLLQRT